MNATEQDSFDGDMLTGKLDFALWKENMQTEHDNPQAQLEHVARLVLARTEEVHCPKGCDGVALDCKCHPTGYITVPVRDALTDALWKKCDAYGCILPDCYKQRTFAHFGSGEFSGLVGKAIKPLLELNGIGAWNGVWYVLLEFDDPATLAALEKALEGVKP